MRRRLGLRLVRWVMTGLALALMASPAGAFTIASGFGDGCHERITAAAFQDFLLDFQFYGLVPPPDETWRDVSGWALEQFGIDPDGVSDVHAFILVSLIIGVRAPDTDGHSVTDFAALRRLHADPRDEGQYAHALRGLNDDGPAGDEIAVEGTRAVIRSLVEETVAVGELFGDDQYVEAPMYFDFYGRSKVTVYRPIYALGQAAHALQDSFAHTIRDDASTLHQVVTVFNYVEAITEKFDAERDGLPHSDSTDDCSQSSELADAAVLATVDLFLAAREMLSRRDPDAVDVILDRWLTLKPGCTEANDYCDNLRWLALAEREQTQPYLSAITGCRSTPGVPSGAGWALMLMLIGVARARQKVRSARL